MTELDPAPFAQLVQRIDERNRLLRAWPLTGGVSAQVTALQIERTDGTTEKLVVRQHGECDRASNPHIARDEFRLLEIVREHGVVAPRPLFVDESCDLFPTPVIVVEYVDGETIFDAENITAHVTRMADQLAMIHSVVDSPELSFLPRVGKGYSERPTTLDDTLNEGRIRDTLESVKPPTQVNDSVLLHGDYWPGNLLWNGGEIAAVIDWEDASLDDPLVDLGNSRLEIAFAFGLDTMRTFTDRYQALVSIDVTNLPYWDLRAALRPCGRMDEWNLAASTKARMRERHTVFVDEAVASLLVP